MPKRRNFHEFIYVGCAHLGDYVYRDEIIQTSHSCIFLDNIFLVLFKANTHTHAHIWHHYATLEQN